jgi:glutamyl-Q tRNA(Asp) synthetase
MTVTTRFAPSPTGRLHAGHAFSATQAHDFARKRSGKFLLRIEDIDGTRSRPEHVETILRDLEWLGLRWDGEVVFQSQRLHLYEAALQRLREQGLLYSCYCTRADIAASLTASHGPEGAIYPGTCRALKSPDLDKPHCWRLDMAKALATIDPARLTFHDSRHGTIHADAAAHGDIVLARKDAPASYHLAVTLDDAAQGVTDIVRGDDLLPATDVHRALQALLDLPTPRYHHHALLHGPDGKRLAKRHGAPALAVLREAGIDGPALADALRRGELPVGIGAAND